MLTIAIPTQNRPAFLLRLLRYYAGLGVKNQILIFDSSTPNQQLTLSAIEPMIKAGLNIKYNICSNETPFMEKLLDMAKGIKTKYSVLGADDDFFIPETLNEAVRFLDTHSDYSVFHGQAMAFKVKVEGGVDNPAHGMITTTSQYSQRAVEQSSSSERLLDGLMNYTPTWYSVHRSDLLLENIHKTSRLAVDGSFIELIMFALDMIQGKVRKSDRLYMARQGFYRSIDYKGHTSHPTVLDWIISPDWGDHFNRSRSYLTDQLVQHDDIDPEKATLIVRDSLLSYLGHRIKLAAPHLAWRANQLLERETLGVKTISSTSDTRRKKDPKSRNAIPEEMALSALLKPGSPFHADFLPVYRAVSNPPPTS